MLGWVTNRMRLRAAGILAVLYAFCVLAPTGTFALGDSARAIDCLTGSLGQPHVHQHDGIVAHVHQDGSVHHHSKDPHAPGKGCDTQCCCALCLSALPAVPIGIPNPAPAATRAAAIDQDGVSGRAPDRLDRPPISLLSL
jgi:hypothetical protein